MADYIIRDARPDDAPFLAKCIMAGMHFYDFETDIPDESDIYERLIECERREDLLCRGRARGTTCSAQMGTGRGGQMGTARSAQ